MIIEGQIDVDVIIDGVELPLHLLGCPYIQMDTSREIGLPTLLLKISDPQYIIRGLISPQEGSLVAIRLGITAQSKTDYEFRVSNSVEGSGSYTIEAYANFPRFVSATLRDAYVGTAATTLRRIAEFCQMEHDVVDTNDNQVWYPANNRVLNFVRKIVGQSHVNADSIMHAYITLAGKLRLRDINKMDASVALLGTSNGIPLLEVLPFTNGSKNVFGGYTRRLVAQYPTLKEYSALSLSSNAKLNMHPRMSGYIRENIVDITPIIHPLNQHINAFEAQYRNRRGRSLISLVGLSVSYSAKTSIEGLDYVDVDLAAPIHATNIERGQKLHNGKWLVINKSIYVESARYYERLELRRSGLEKESEPNF